MIDNNESGFGGIGSRFDKLPPIAEVKYANSNDEHSNTYKAINPYSASFTPVKPKEIKIFDFIIIEYKGRLLIKGKYISQSIYFHIDPLCTVAVGVNKTEVLIFPNLNIFEQSKAQQPIEPFEEGQFCHFIAESEAALINKSDTINIELTSFDSRKSRFREFFPIL